MRISLDWDKISRKTAFSRCTKISKVKFIKRVELYQSPMGKGFHVYVYYDQMYVLKSFEFVFRKILHDDPKRLEMDLKYRFDEPSVLFSEKHIGNKIYKEKFIKVFKK